ncbi:hypothetical protein [Croceivirga thetidis]|uniref:Outer membrane protein beta-barrel domain-containing protein n=1 Tax=Croceivirga thetidis TaxID=2721623 RepID=A0ABX1GPI2_9FLAO|nr:hypothetical protein [Croceivirga thetidis]NKI31838.1 hypothetical protein [Croceivirga thetidis]
MKPHIKIAVVVISLLSLSKVNGQKLEGDFLTTHLLKPIDFSVPRFTLGFIKQIDQDYSIGIDVGYGSEGLAFFKDSDFPKNDYKLKEIGLEFYKFFESSRTLSEYVSLEVHYLNHVETRINEFYEPDNQTYLQFDQADYERNKIALNAKFGILARLKNSFGINAYAGVGVRIRDNKFENIINPRPSDSIENEGPYPVDIVAAFDNTYERAGTRIGLNVTFGANIILQLKKAP